MKKSIIAIAFLLLCPFYGVRAQERPFFDLSGKGWHLWQDKKATWQTEDIYLTLEDASAQGAVNDCLSIFFFEFEKKKKNKIVYIEGLYHL